VKRITSRIRAAIGAATFVAFASPAAAQRPAPAAGPGLRGGLPGYLAEHPQALSLNDEQTARLRTVAQWLERSNSALREQVRSALGGRTARELTAEQRYQLGRQVRPLRDQLRANHVSAVDSVHAILTPDQWQRLGERRMAMRAWRGGFMRGRMGLMRGRARFGFRGGPWGLWWGWRRPG
jgi:Spy/CpxP family protein refolding chaperone